MGFGLISNLLGMGTNLLGGATPAPTASASNGDLNSLLNSLGQPQSQSASSQPQTALDGSDALGGGNGYSSFRGDKGPLSSNGISSADLAKEVKRDVNHALAKMGFPIHAAPQGFGADRGNPESPLSAMINDAVNQALQEAGVLPSNGCSNGARGGQSHGRSHGHSHGSFGPSSHSSGMNNVSSFGYPSQGGQSFSHMGPHGGQGYGYNPASSCSSPFEGGNFNHFSPMRQSFSYGGPHGGRSYSSPMMGSSFGGGGPRGMQTIIYNGPVPVLPNGTVSPSFINSLMRGANFSDRSYEGPRSYSHSRSYSYSHNNSNGYHHHSHGRNGDYNNYGRDNGSCSSRNQDCFRPYNYNQSPVFAIVAQAANLH